MTDPRSTLIPPAGQRPHIADVRGDARREAARVIDAVRATTGLNAFIGFDADRLREAARADGPRTGALAGVAIAIKDNIDVAGWPTSAGTPALRNTIATGTAPAVQRLVDAGALVAGKTNLHELAFGITSRNAAFGFVANPHDPSRSAGGSSGGSAAAVGAGVVAAALGTDTGGSMRVPAAFCGIVGFRPSHGRYPPAGVVPLAASRDVIGPMANNVADVALLDAIICGDDSPLQLPDRPLVLGVPHGFLTDELDVAVDVPWRTALRTLAAAGARLVDVEVSGLLELIDATSPVVTRRDLRRDFPAHILARTAGLNATQFVASIASPDVRAVFEFMLGDVAVPGAADCRHVEQVLLPRMRALIATTFAAHGLDAWLFPTVPVPPFPLEADREVLLNGTPRPLFQTGVRNLQHASLAGMPSLSLPMPVAAAALPCGLCVEALPGRDRPLLGVAAWVEAVLAGRGSR